MDLSRIKPSKNLKDLSWVKALFEDFMYPAAERHEDVLGTGYHRSYINDPTGDFSPEEMSMARSGANYDDLMFARAMRYQNAEGFSPYFNPNYKSKKKK